MSDRSSLLDRRALFSSAAAAALLAATGVSAAGAPRRGGRLRMALSGASRSDSWVAGEGLFMQVARQGVVFDSLTEVAADGTLRGELALNWQSDREGRSWTFDLRRGVAFHDGARFGARDVVASLQSALGAGAVLRELGRHQVSITLAEPNTGLPLLISGPAFVIRPAHALTAGIGTGLYRVRQFSAGQQLIATRVAGHYKNGQAGWFDEVELVSVPSPDVRAQALAEEMVDAADLDAGKTPIARSIVAHPAQIGTQRPMDNLRAAERWWFA